MAKIRPIQAIEQLKKTVAGEVHSDILRRHLLATDGSIFKALPACVVYPRQTADVVACVRFAAENKLPLHARGAGSGLCGAALGTGVVVDFSKFMNRLIRIDEGQKRFECEPGYRFGELDATLADTGLFFPPDPSSGEYATFGGMYATNASGAHSVKYGNVADYIVDAQIVLGNGEIITLSDIQSRPPDTLPQNLNALFHLYENHRDAIETAYPPIACNVAGYNLRGLVQHNRLTPGRLFAGAEGTLGIVTRLTFRLLERPAHDALVVAYFDDILSAARAVQKTIPMGPAGIEIMDKSLLRLARENDATLRDKIPDGIDNVLLIEFDGDRERLCRELAHNTLYLLKKERLTDRAYPAIEAEEKAKFWAVRKAAVPILYKLKGEKKILALIEDAAVPTNRLTEYFTGLYNIFQRNQVDFVLYGHIAKGLLHTRPLLNLKKKRDVNLLKILSNEAFELVHSLGGVMSGEHGDGRLRSAFIKKQYPGIYDLFTQTKDLLDEKNILNPDIITVNDPGQMQKNLRYGPAYHSESLPKKTLRWPEGLVAEIEKCHGCTKCTTLTTATRMCPIYKITRDEAAAPKAKANLLRALISGAIADRYLYEKSFRQVMDQCANCGSCRKECPSGVNIPKMAMEARAHYVQRFGPSRHAQVVTRVDLAGRTTRKFSRALSAIMKNETARKAAERLTGISARRHIVEFPTRSFFERIAQTECPRESPSRLSVVYFAGCFAGYIKPRIGEALVTVLTRMGMTVHTPPQHCCGLPAMTKGMIPTARRRIQRNLANWADIMAGASHVVVTCSSCGYALMKDWPDLLGDARVKQVSRKVIHVSRLVDRYLDRLDLSPCKQKIAYHQPCHLKIQPDPDSTRRLFSKIPGLEVDNLNSHCCGMIGSWGMAEDNYDLSMKIGGHMLGKLDRSRAPVGVTDCPTCRMQMEENTRKPIRHPVEILAACLR